MKLNTQGIAPTWYTPKKWRPKEPETVGDDVVADTLPEIDADPIEPGRFKLKPLTSYQMMDLTDLCDVNTATGSATLTAAARKYALRNGVDDWDGFESEDGTELRMTQKNLQLVAFDVLNEVAEEIVTMSTLTEGERKN